MALIRSNIYSSALTTAAAMDLVIPLEKAERDSYPVLWLLSPLGNDQSAWHRHARIEELAETYGVLVAMPGMSLSFGQNMYYGLKYHLMLTKELPAQLEDYYPADLSRQYIAGAQEGGYIAAQAALENPAQYRSALCLSYGCVTDEVFMGTMEKMAENAFGTSDMKSLKGGNLCLKKLIEKNGMDGIHLAYGREDAHSNSAEQLSFLLPQEQVKILDGALSWRQWEEQLEQFMKQIQ